MTDNDIIKALEHCVSSTGSEACDGCPFNENDICEKEYNSTEKYALDLILRQKAEIERLNIYANDLLMLYLPKNERSEAKTYSDVIKAFERCSCSAMFDALDVTLRQAAENERLQKDIDIIQSANVELYSALDNARAEAITEFETKLTMHFGTYTDKDCLRVIDMLRLIKQIAKELKEGVNNA